MSHDVALRSHRMTDCQVNPAFRPSASDGGGGGLMHLPDSVVIGMLAQQLELLAEHARPNLANQLKAYAGQMAAAALEARGARSPSRPDLRLVP